MSIHALHTDFSSTIFVVDDDLFLNELFCQFLQSKGFTTHSATSLAEAVIVTESGKATDLILLDYNLGDGTGLDFLTRLQKIANNNMPPVIMVSTNEDPEFLENCFVAGVADYVIKPVNLSLLALKVSSLIRAVALQRLISLQNIELARFKQDAEREEAVAKFTYEYLLRHNSEAIDGVDLWLKPSASFSGDIAIAKVSPGGDLFFLLADATGHGLSAAITVMPVVGIFNTMVAKGFDLQPIVTEMNSKLVRDTPHDRFVAAILVHIDNERNEIHIWNGGMPTAYWISDGEIIQQFKSQQMALGVLDDEMFDASVETRRLVHRGIFFACSDGLLEETNTKNECFSKERLIEIIHKKPESLQETVIEALAAHSGKLSYSDDVSICVLTPGKIPMRSYCSLDERSDYGHIEEELSDFFWHIRITGRKLSNCELPPLCNKFLQHIGIEQSFRQIIFLIVSEMVSNAIDHGILRLDSQIKEEPEGFTRYFYERETRLARLTSADAIDLELRWEVAPTGTQLVISVEDTGDGYSYSGGPLARDDLLSGRGLKLIKNLSKRVEVFPPGNRIEAVISTS